MSCGLTRTTTLAARQSSPRCFARPAVPTLSSRCFASSSGSGGGSSQWQSLPANFVPFARSLPDAQAAYLGWANGQWLVPSSLKSLQAVHTVDQAYLPFYVFDAVVESRFGGRVGFNYSELVYNAHSRSYQTVQRTRWREVGMERQASRVVYSSDDPSMQVYGAFKYKWEPIQVVKGPLSGAGTVVTPSQMRPQDFAGREVDVFEMRLETAQGRVLDYIRAKEEERGRQQLLAQYGADEAQVTAEIRIASLSLRRVYQPAYVFHLEHLGHQFEVMVNGRTGAVWGQHIYSGTKAGAAAFAASASLWVWAGGVMHAVPLGGLSFVGAVLLPTLIGAVVGRQWASVRQWFREKKRVADRAADARMQPEQEERRWGRWGWGQQEQQQSAGWNEQQRTEQRYEQQYRQQQREQQQRQQQQQPFGQRFRRAAPTQT